MVGGSGCADDAEGRARPKAMACAWALPGLQLEGKREVAWSKEEEKEEKEKKRGAKLQNKENRERREGKKPEIFLGSSKCEIFEKF